MKTNTLGMATGLLFGMSLALGADAQPQSGGFGAERHSEHRGGDDLLSAGLGLTPMLGFARKGEKVVEDNLKAFDAGYEGVQ